MVSGSKSRDWYSNILISIIPGLSTKKERPYHEGERIKRTGGNTTHGLIIALVLQYYSESSFNFDIAQSNNNQIEANKKIEKTAYKFFSPNREKKLTSIKNNKMYLAIL